MTERLYFTADLASALVVLPDPAPPALWLDPAAGGCVPAFLLTPGAYLHLLDACGRLEDGWARGEYPAAKMEDVWAKWPAVEEYARRAWDAAALEAAKGSPFRLPRLAGGPPWAPSFAAEEGEFLALVAGHNEQAQERHDAKQADLAADTRGEKVPKKKRARKAEAADADVYTSGR